MSLAADQLLYLDRVKALYPGGIPRQLLERSAVCPVLFVANPESLKSATSFDGAGGELLKAAVTKGLEIELSKVSVIIFEGREALAKSLEAVSPRIIFLLGEKVAHEILGVSDKLEQLRSGAFLFSQIPTLVSFDPNDVASNPELKRGFWEDLKRVKAVIRAG